MTDHPVRTVREKYGSCNACTEGARASCCGPVSSCCGASADTEISIPSHRTFTMKARLREFRPRRCLRPSVVATRLPSATLNPGETYSILLRWWHRCVAVCKARWTHRKRMAST